MLLIAFFPSSLPPFRFRCRDGGALPRSLAAVQASAAQALQEAAAAEARIAAQLAAAASMQQAAQQAAASAGGAAVAGDASSLQMRLRCAEEAAEKRATEAAELRALVESHQQQLWCARLRCGSRSLLSSPLALWLGTPVCSP